MNLMNSKKSPFLLTVLLSLFFISACAQEKQEEASNLEATVETAQTEEASKNTASLTANDESCLETRGALDIGSGSTKMKVAVVNVCLQKIETTLFEESKKVGYKEDLKNSQPENVLSPEITEAGLKAIQELVAEASKVADIKKMTGVATAVFRDATNGRETIINFSKETGIPLQVITQEEEALLGFYGGMAYSDQPIENTLVWDIGGGSMQMTGYNPETTPSFVIYKGKTASVSFKEAIIAQVQKKDIAEISTPNPIGANAANAMVLLSAKQAKEDADLMIMKSFIETHPNIRVVGIGGVLSISVDKQTKREEGTAFTQEQIKAAINERANLTDAEIGGEYANTEISNLGLVLGFMKELRIKEVLPAKVNLTDGALISPNYWPEN